MLGLPSSGPGALDSATSPSQTIEKTKTLQSCPDLPIVITWFKPEEHKENANETVKYALPKQMRGPEMSCSSSLKSLSCLEGHEVNI